MKKLPKAILFDADGTLYTSNRLNHEANQVTAKEMYGFDYTWEMFETNQLRGTISAMKVIETHHGISVDDDEYLARRHVHYERIITEKLEPMPGLPGFLKWCKSKGITCVIVSGARVSMIETCLEAIGLRNYFKDILALDHFGYDKTKPHAFPYKLALKKLGLKTNQALAVEDTDRGIKSAKAAGLRCIGIRNDINTEAELAETDQVIDHYDELKAYLLK